MNMADEKVEPVKKKSKQRALSGPWHLTVGFLAIALSVFQLWCTIFTAPNPMFFRAIFLAMAMAMAFLLYPARKNSPGGGPSAADILFSASSLVVGFYVAFVYNDLVWRMGEIYWYETWMGIATLLLVMEMARRVVGWPLTLIAVTFLLYTLFGNHSPVFAHSGFSVERTVSQFYLTLEGLYGAPMGVLVSFVFLFVLFSSFLQLTGAGDFLINISYALTGRYVAGPAKTSVIASGFLGSISGSIPANVVGTGSFTIPMMRRLGYTPEYAGAIEVAASTGGQLMPPIMGAGAFLMAEWTGISYGKIVLVSIAPAFLYYASLMIFIHFNALKNGIGKVDPSEVPGVMETLKNGWYHILPLIILTLLLMNGFSASYAAIAGIVCIIAVSLVEGLLRTLRERGSLAAFLKGYGLELVKGTAKGGRGAITIAAAVACAGMVIGAVGLTGIGLRLSHMIISLSAGNLMTTIVLIALTCTILGMEMPVVAAYMICAILAVPALMELGVPLLPAHLMTFWFSQMAATTPPVCVSAYAASAVAGGDPMRTGVLGWRLGQGIYIIPVLFVFTPLVTGSWHEILKVCAISLLGLTALSLLRERFFLARLSWGKSLLLLVTVGLCLYPSDMGYLAGAALFAGICIHEVRRKRALTLREA